MKKARKKMAEVAGEMTPAPWWIAEYLIVSIRPNKPNLFTFTDEEPPKPLPPGKVVYTLVEACLAQRKTRRPTVRKTTPSESHHRSN